MSFLLTTHFHNDHNLGNRAYMDAFPALTIIAHVETKKDMDLFGPGSRSRELRGTAAYERMLASGKNGNGSALTAADKKELETIIVRRKQLTDALEKVTFQTATLSVRPRLHRGPRRSRRAGQVPREVATRPATPSHTCRKKRSWRRATSSSTRDPYIYDGYPSEWIHTLENLAQLDAGAIVPGHGPILRDKTYVFLLRDLIRRAPSSRMNEALRKTGPAMFRSVNDVKGSIDLSPFRQRFAGNDKERGAAFDAAAAQLVKVVFREASLR